ncbi:MAG: hypothetical protein ACO2Z9_03420 [Crocinitomicaceae bacterium]
MTEEEAEVILNLSEFEDLEDACDQKVFEFKQYLLSKVPFVKTYESKRLQMDRVQSAMSVLGVELSTSQVDFDQVYETNPADLEDCLKSHQALMSKWRLKVGQANDIQSLKLLMQKALKIYRDYAAGWTDLTGEMNIDEEVKASVEFDPVDLIQEIKNAQGEVEQSELLQKETKRLFLWLKYNGYE